MNKLLLPMPFSTCTIVVCTNVVELFMKRNVTLSADEKLIENARRIAKAENKTLNDVFREWLEAYQSRAASSLGYRDLMKQLSHVKSGGKFTREKMNER